MLGDQNGGAQLPVDFFQCIQKIGGGNGVQLAGGLVQDQNFRLHDHHGGQIQQLLLPAGERRYLPVEPILDAEKAGHLRHPQPHDALLAAQVFQPEGQLVPHLIGDDLVVRVLHHKADLSGLLPQADLGQGHTIQRDLAASAPVGGQHGFQMPQQGGLSAAGLAAQQHIFPLGQPHGDITQRGSGRAGVGEAYMFQREICHAITSLMCSSVGISSRQQ